MENAEQNSALIPQDAVALAHHWAVSMRGGEKLLGVLAAMFPAAPIYTLLVRRANLAPELRERDWRPSWLQGLRVIPDLQRRALPVLASAAQSLDASNYRAVICSDAALIKAIRTDPAALKLCYCHTPMRCLWELYEQYLRDAGALGRLGLRLLAGGLRQADLQAAATVTAFVANSRCVARRIRRCYGRPSVVIPPPVDTSFPLNAAPPGDFYLVVGEHVGYKRHDLAIEACNRLRRRLVVIGSGPGLRRMRRLAGKTVEVLGWRSDDEIREHLARCRALLFCGEEDFGLVPVEAQAAGRPVIAYAAGGALDTVVPGKSGIFFEQQTVDAVAGAIQRFEADPPEWAPQEIQAHASRFSGAEFQTRFGALLHWVWQIYSEGGGEAVREAMLSVREDEFCPGLFAPETQAAAAH